MKRSILIVDDDSRIRTSLAEVLEDGTTNVRTAEHAEAALSLLADSPADVVLTDVRMPGIGGLELLNLLKERSPDTAVILMTAYQDLPTVATAMREGAVDFLVKPLDLHQLRRILDNVFADRRIDADLGTSTEQPPDEGVSLVGRDPQMVEIFKAIGQVAGTPANVIIRGESGTGKELIARAIHMNSAHASAPFVAVDCTALPATLLESELFGHVKGAFTGATSNRQGRFALAGDGTVFNTGVAWRDGMLADSGRAAVTGTRDALGAFKTPSLRNVARTAPYMHDGSFATLEEVVDFYDVGGNPNSHQDPDIRPLNLSTGERSALLAFLRSLSGKVTVGEARLPDTQH